MTKIIDDKLISKQIKDEVREETRILEEKGIRLTLAVVQVGEDPASTVYVRNKQKACEYTGIASVKIAMPAETTQKELLSKVRELNEDPSINGILVQLPLPKGLDANEVIRAISPLKDVDGFHPQSVGALSIGLPGFKSCTPAGIIELIKRSGIETEGRECVIVGRSNIVGKPMAMMMIRENATVTVAHSRTVDLPAVCRRADILITAVGRAKMFNREYVKPGAAVIDCGMNRDENGKLCGDVDYEDVFPVASAITPVPGGVGPMTVAMLMKNCLDSARIQGIV
ncbi:MAG: bifunctional methylenetetrahydrofolate dehydrogenase/methenyltetrahydrofolate cyclohydrolase FolD [Lachnospiraceae bacterium]|nr:bifunctional methylenetetrahydrofolate dehydrogenase/methenyltetrahydrofolate cyclohydrolase FolD [Lachnospiraceae bacterium]